MPDVFSDVYTGPVSVDSLPGAGTNRKVLVMFLVDATRSMEGQAITQVNLAMQELVGELKSFAADNGVDLKLAIMSFTEDPVMEMEPTDIHLCFDIPRISTRPGLTMYGGVYGKLDRMLTKDEGGWLHETGKLAPPVLVLLTDGAPKDDYSPKLEKLRRNGYFAEASRCAVLMGEAAEDPEARAAVAEFVSGEDMILTTEGSRSVLEHIRLATLRTIRGDTDLALPEPAADGENGPDTAW